MIRFNIALYNYRNKQIYVSQLKVLLQSITNIYGNEAEIAVLYNRVDNRDIQEIKKKLPKVILKHFKIDFSQPPKDNIFNTWATRKLILWNELLNDSDLEQQIFLDTDMLIVKKIDKFFDNLFDIGYTHKSIPEEVLRKPLNTAVILVNNSQKVKKFMEFWKNKALKRLQSKNCYGSGWGATDQQILGETLGTRDIIKMSNQIIKKKGIRFKGFPCESLNNILSPLPNDPNVFIIHYKGSWRNILTEKSWENSLRPRTENDPLLYQLWMDNLEEYNSK